MFTGSQEEESKVKKGYKLPRLPMANTDLARLINSDEIQSVVNEPKEAKRGKTLKKNPLKNLGSMLKLNPYSKTIRRLELANQVRVFLFCPFFVSWLCQDFRFCAWMAVVARGRFVSRRICGDFTWDKSC